MQTVIFTAIVVIFTISFTGGSISIPVILLGLWIAFMLSVSTPDVPQIEKDEK